MKQRWNSMAWCFAVALGFVTLVPELAYAQKLVYVVRHAERADGGATPGTMSGAPADPLLSAAGSARADHLAAMLADAGITAIYATEFKRTQETARPLAVKTKVSVSTVAAAQTPALLNQLKTKHANDVVLVVAHSNTMPAIIKGLGGPDIAIGDNDYGDLFIIVPNTGTVSRIKF